MRKFILKITLILIPIFVFFSLLEILTRAIPNDYSYKNEYLNNNAKDLQVLALGSSHCFFGVNPEYFSMNSFNASHISQSIDFDYFIFNKYKDKLTNLKYVLLPISYFTMPSRLEDGIEHWRVKNYNIYYGARCDFLSKDNYEIFNNEYEKLIFMTLEYIFAGKDNKTCSKLGFGLDYSQGQQQDLDKSGKGAAKRHAKTSDNNVAHNHDLLKKFITLCRDKNIKVILFTPPAWHTYRCELDSRQLDIMKKTCVSLSNEFSNVLYHDYMEDSRFSADDFYDADHLNGKGAKKLTSILDDAIKASETTVRQ
ncbi:MAG: hypothetical protein FIB02_08375 [Desulfuromonas sp.]|nr:hypothetical protein [Desulfuromonas sp.]